MRADLPERLTGRLHLPLPGFHAQRTMEPELSFGRHFGPPQEGARPAAVVALLHLHEGRWHVPLMLRPESLVNHAGQISLPGGTIEPGETSEEAALRELEEELGVARFSALLLGQLSPLYVFGTNFLVFPWVAAVRTNLEFRPNAAEVQAIFHVRLDHLLKPENRGEHIGQRGGVRFRAPHFDWEGHQIWGATGMILAELAAVLAEMSAPEP